MTNHLRVSDYNKYVEDTFYSRFISPIQLHDFILEKYGQSVKKIGHSTLGLPIFRIRVGSGPIAILAWTQMHGNESSATLGMLDFLKLYSSNKMFAEEFAKKFSMDLILMLNPDGAMHWRRENALGLDINRDFREENTPEMHTFKTKLRSKNYHLALNCHDQRTIFGNDALKTPATLSVLAPSIDNEAGINNARKRAIQLIGNMYADLKNIDKANITRFDDTFYPKATGDNIQLLGVPTILMESGHFPNDYGRKEARKLFLISFLSLLKYLDYEVLENDYLYYEIPKSSNNFRDIIIKNINIISNGFISTIDVSIQYQERLNKETKQIDYIPIIENTGNLSHLKGWKEYDLITKTYTYKEGVFIKGNEAYNLFEHLGIEYSPVIH